MKNHIFIGFLFIPFVALTQIQKDKWLVGGNGTFSYSKSKELRFTSWQLSPSAGYFFLDKFAAGLRAGFSSDTYDYVVDKFRISAISLSPFLRYYFLPINQKVNLLGDVSFGYSWVKIAILFSQVLPVIIFTILQ